MLDSLYRRWQRNPLAWSKSAITLAVLGLSALLARRATSRLLFLSAAAVLFLLLLNNLRLGLFLLIPTALLVPFEPGTGTQTSLNAAIMLVAALVGAWVLRMVVVERRVQLAASPVNRPALAFILVITLALLAGSIPWVPFASLASLPAQLGGWALYVFSLGLLLLVGNLLRDERDLRALTWLFLALGGLHIVGLVFPPARVLGRLLRPGALGSVFWVWLVALAYSQCLRNRDLHIGWRLLLGLLVGTVLYFNFFRARGWASGWLPPLVAILVITWLRSWPAGFLLTITGLVYFLLPRSDLSSQVATLQQPTLATQAVALDQYSLVTRIAAWQVLIEVFKLNPILGLGPSNYYHYTPLYPILGWYVNFNSHNQYVDILLQTGITGLACFAWLVIAIGQVGWRLRRKLLSDRVSNGFARAYVEGALGGLIGTLAAGMLADWFLPFVYNIGIAGFRASLLAWLFLGGLITLEQITSQPSQPMGAD